VDLSFAGDIADSGLAVDIVDSGVGSTVGLLAGSTVDLEVA